jgi:hypothetical protein
MDKSYVYMHYVRNYNRDLESVWRELLQNDFFEQ